MAHRTNELIKNLHTLFDIILTVGSFVGAYYIKNFILPESLRGLTEEINYYIVLLVIVIVWYVVFRFYNVYNNFFEKGRLEIFFEVLKATGTSMLILVLLLFVDKMHNMSRILLLTFYIINIITLFFAKITIRHFYRKHNKNVHNMHNIVIIGSKKRAIEAIHFIRNKKDDYNIIGCLEINTKLVGKTVVDDIKVIGHVDNLIKLITSNVVDEVIFAMSLKDIEFADIYMILIEMVGVKVRIIPDWQIHSLNYHPGVATIRYETFGGVPTMLLTATAIQHSDIFIKTILDFIMAVLFIIFASPFFIVVPVFIKLASRGPVFFMQERVGLNGRSFKLYKFRTMVVDAEARLAELKSKNEMDGPVFKIKKDPRIIPYIGTFLRKTSLDELPQLINIIKGEMSFVGPRPPLPSEVADYEIWQRRRISMKPGITCLWQISPRRNDLTFNQWMNLDLEYIDNWSLKLDIIIILRTIMVVVGASGR